MKSKIIKGVAIFLALNMLIDTILIGTAFALTSGPSSPEFTDFEPVATTDMVNLFSGDFNYNLPVINIPGPDGGGYALSLSYHSGSTSETEASWVGHGWSLNPGAINRNTRGFPDDYKNTDVKRYSKNRVNWSGSVQNSVGVEIFGKKESEEKSDSSNTLVRGGSISANTTIRFNNRQGFTRYYGLGLGAAGVANLSVNRSAQGVTYGANINVARILMRAPAAITEREKSLMDKDTYDEEVATRALKRRMQGLVSSTVSSFTSTYGIYSFAYETRATSLARYKGMSFNWTSSVTANIAPFPLGPNVGLTGNFNLQESEPFRTYKANGFMNNPKRAENAYPSLQGSEAYAGADVLSDYYVERSSPYNNQELYLGIPFNNADYFLVVGEGLNGSFRYHPYKVGHYYPNFLENRTRIGQIGFDLHIGSAFGFGADFGVGSQRSIVSDWSRQGNTDQYQFNEEGFMRFSNDMGGSVEYGVSDETQNNTAIGYASLQGRAPIVNNIGTDLNLDKASSSSSIAFHTFQQLQDDPDSQFDKNAKINVSNATNPESIVEVSVFNSSGANYVYGQPVFARNEANLSVDVNSGNPKDASDTYVYRNLSLRNSNNEYEANTDPHTVLQGEIRNTPYAVNYLMTQITTPDYIDINNNGPDDKDFGGWTRFAYRQKYGAEVGDWYRWRTPYSGLFYNRNQISDTKDDLGSVSSGEKEVYYLKSIETKTHIAFFVTNKATADTYQDVLARNGLEGQVNEKLLQGSGLDRLDGLDAVTLNNSEDPAANRQNAKGNNSLEYLEKVVLIAKNSPNTAIKTVRFAYDYSLIQNLPNNKNGRYPNSKSNNESGKLTLKRVWFEYEGVSESRISPYEFEYAYKPRAEFDATVRERYPEVFGTDENSQYIGDQFSQAAQNPDYAGYLLDAWGAHQLYGRERNKYAMPWNYQGKEDNPYQAGSKGWRKERSLQADAGFDPAAWQLKRIKLPSGGEMLIEYEQKDYAYVQDRKPMVMTSLTAAVERGGTALFRQNPSYTLNLKDLGIAADEIDEQVALMKKIFIEEEEKIYFKFLYKLSTDYNNNTAPSLDNCASEYISGYSSVEDVVKEGDNIKVILQGVKLEGGDRTEVPLQVCYDFYSTQRMGKWYEGCTADIENEMEGKVNGLSDELLSDNDGARLTAGLRIIPEFLVKLQGKLIDMNDYGIPERSEVGIDMNLDLSYLRVPTIHAKKGGGVRVKRLLMYDAGIENGTAELYGQEFTYEDFEYDEAGNFVKKISSGVATNEPAQNREENPLVAFLPKGDPSWFQRITAGDEREQAEGPIGESILPGPSVGHSRVVVENIYQGKTGTGFSVDEYFTVKDYPFDRVYGETDNPSDFEPGSRGVDFTNLNDNKQQRSLVVPAGLFYFEESNVRATQGYRFIINSMHGQIKRTASYAGVYPAIESQADLNKMIRVSEQAYQYFEPGEKIKMMQPDGSWYWDLPGKEMDVAMEMKSITEKTLNVKLSIDGLVGLAALPPFYFPLVFSFEYANRGIETHATSKVIRYPAIVKSVTAFQDGVTSISEYMAFDPYSGRAVLTKTYDGFEGTQDHDGSMYALNLPASWLYEGMQPKMSKGQYKPENTNQVNADFQSVVSYGANGNPLREEGDDWAANPIKDVVSTSVQTYKQSWFTEGSALAQAFGLDADAIAQLNKIWRPWQSYVYRKDVKSANNTSIKEGGTINEIVAFDPANPAEDWMFSNEVVAYSPQGNMIEEKNVLDIYSAAAFGYNETLPILVAGNAASGTVRFKDYEYRTDYATAEAIQITFTNKAHSGKGVLSSTGSSVSLLQQAGEKDDRLIADKQLTEEGALVKIWIRDAEEQALQISVNGTQNFDLQKDATIGHWSLYRAYIDKATFTEGEKYSFALTGIISPVLIDDFRVQPLEAQMTCYVYDSRTLKVITQFDDQHFGLIYQYNQEGKLIRKLIETERGVKTVQETQYNMPKVSR